MRDLVAIMSSDSFYVIQFDCDGYTSCVEVSRDIGDEGMEGALDIIAKISEVFVVPYAHVHNCSSLVSSVTMAKWISNCFVYTNLANQLNYLISSQTHTVTHFDM